MEVILQKDVKNLGKTGDRIRVKAGYARNHLIPKKWALVLDESNLKALKHKKKVIEAKKKKAVEERKALLEKLSAVEIQFEMQAQNEGRLFGSITAVDLSAELEKQSFTVDKRDLILEEPIKVLGEHKVKVKLDDQLQTEIKVNVKALDSKKTAEKKGFFSRFLSTKPEDIPEDIPIPAEKPVVDTDKEGEEETSSSKKDS